MGTAASVKDKLGEEPPAPASAQPPPSSPSKRKKDGQKSDKERRGSAATSATGGGGGGGGGRRRDERRGSRSAAVDNARRKRPSREKLPGNGGGPEAQRHGADGEPFTPEGGGSFKGERSARGRRPSHSGPSPQRPDRGAPSKPPAPTGKPRGIAMRQSYSSDEDGSVDEDTMVRQATSTLKGTTSPMSDTASPPHGRPQPSLAPQPLSGHSRGADYDAMRSPGRERRAGAGPAGSLMGGGSPSSHDRGRTPSASPTSAQRPANPRPHRLKSKQPPGPPSSSTNSRGPGPGPRPGPGALLGGKAMVGKPQLEVRTTVSSDEGEDEDEDEEEVEMSRELDEGVYDWTIMDTKTGLGKANGRPAPSGEPAKQSDADEAKDFLADSDDEAGEAEAADFLADSDDGEETKAPSTPVPKAKPAARATAADEAKDFLNDSDDEGDSDGGGGDAKPVPDEQAAGATEATPARQGSQKDVDDFLQDSDDEAEGDFDQDERHDIFDTAGGEGDDEEEDEEDEVGEGAYDWTMFDTREALGSAEDEAAAEGTGDPHITNSSRGEVPGTPGGGSGAAVGGSGGKGGGTPGRGPGPPIKGGGPRGPPRGPRGNPAGRGGPRPPRGISMAHGPGRGGRGPPPSPHMPPHLAPRPINASPTGPGAGRGRGPGPGSVVRGGGRGRGPGPGGPTGGPRPGPPRPRGAAAPGGGDAMAAMRSPGGSVSAGGDGSGSNGSGGSPGGPRLSFSAGTGGSGNSSPVTPSPSAPTPKTPVTGVPQPGIVKDTKQVKRKHTVIPEEMKGKATHGTFVKNRYIVNNYILLEVLGQGSYAEVRLAKDRNTEKLHAIKVINRSFKKTLGDDKKAASNLEDMKREIAIMKKLKHPHVLRLYEVMDDPKVNKLYLVLEYMKGGDLMQIQQGDSKSYSCQAMNDNQVWRVLEQVAQGLKYLHHQNIIHGDIKPQNILLLKPPIDTGIVKIADFGISKTLESGNTTLQDAAGTPAFMCPELCAGEKYDGRLSDVWSLGGTMFMLRFGRPPFIASKVLQLAYKIMHDPLVFPFDVDPNLQNLLRGMLEKDQDKRMTLARVIRELGIHKPTGGASSAPSGPVEGGMSLVSVSNDEIFQSINMRTVTAINEDADEAASPASVKSGHQPPPPARPPISRQNTAKAQHNGAQTPSKGKPGPGRSSVQAPSGGGGGVRSGAPPPPRDGHGIISPNEESRRANAFKRNHSVKRTGGQHSASLQDLMNEGGKGEEGDSDSDEDEEWGDVETPGGGSSKGARGISRLDSNGFNEIMDTLSAQPARSLQQKHTILRGMNLGPGPFKAKLDLHNPALSISASWHTVIGDRDDQEDRVTVIPDYSALGPDLPTGKGTSYERYAFFGIFDGHQGWRCSSALQHTMHLKLVQHPRFPTSPGDAVAAVSTQIDRDLCRKLAADGDQCGSTALVAVFDGPRNSLMIANVGDSRCVLSRNGRAIDLSKEHRCDREDERNRILAAGGSIVQNRVNRTLAVSRAFGDVQHKGGAVTADGGDIIIAVPEVHDEAISVRDEFMVMATDGLWDVMQSQQVVNFVRLRLQSHRDLNRVAEEVTKEALRQQSVDNVSVIIVAFNQEGTGT